MDKIIKLSNELRCEKCGKPQYMVLTNYNVSKPITYEFALCSREFCDQHCTCYYGRQAHV